MRSALSGCPRTHQNQLASHSRSCQVPVVVPGPCPSRPRTRTRTRTRTQPAYVTTTQRPKFGTCTRTQTAAHSSTRLLPQTDLDPSFPFSVDISLFRLQLGPAEFVSFSFCCICFHFLPHFPAGLCNISIHRQCTVYWFHRRFLQLPASASHTTSGREDPKKLAFPRSTCSWSAHLDTITHPTPRGHSGSSLSSLLFSPIKS